MSTTVMNIANSTRNPRTPVMFVFQQCPVFWVFVFQRLVCLGQTTATTTTGVDDDNNRRVLCAM